MTRTGPPSQSLGVDPVNKDVMQKPPRPKNAPVLNRQLLTRILFSASMVVLGTLFIYAYELSDGSMTRRDQTMVSNTSYYSSFSTHNSDLYWLRLSRPRICSSKSRLIMWRKSEQNACSHLQRLLYCSTAPYLLSSATSNLSNGGIIVT